MSQRSDRPALKKTERKRSPDLPASGKVSSSVSKSEPMKKLLAQDLDSFLGRGGKWLVVQLSEDCVLQESSLDVVREIKTLCGESVEFFLPLYVEFVQDKPVCLVLFDGYVFVKVSEEIDDFCFKDKPDTKDKIQHVIGPLYMNGVSKYVTNRDINQFKRDLKKMLRDKIPKKGQKVIPLVGDYKNLEGEVLFVDKDRMIAKVIFALSSRVVEVFIRVINLEIVG